MGFSEGEACFKIKPRYRGKSNVHSFSLEFEIHLHIDDKNLLFYIRDSLGVGTVYLREKSNSCSFIVGNEKDLRVLLAVFDKYKLNGIKYLDYLDFMKAFNLYFDRSGSLTDEMRHDILELYEGINTGRTNFSMPFDHVVKITPYWLLGLIEGEGSFYLRRNPIRPGFQILLTAAQEPLLAKIKEYLENNLGFDQYSLWQIQNSSVLSITHKKAVGKSKPTVTFDIRDLRILQNYFIPFLNRLDFLSKKGLDFSDFKIICKTMYDGGHKNDELKSLLVKLSHAINDFRLSSYNGSIPKQQLSENEMSMLVNALPLSEYLPDGRVIDSATGQVDYQNESSVYLIKKMDGEELLVKSLKEAADILGCHYSTISKRLDGSPFVAEVNGHTVKRIMVFGPLR